MHGMNGSSHDYDDCMLIFTYTQMRLHPQPGPLSWLSSTWAQRCSCGPGIFEACGMLPGRKRKARPSQGCDSSAWGWILRPAPRNSFTWMDSQQRGNDFNQLKEHKGHPSSIVQGEELILGVGWQGAEERKAGADLNDKERILHKRTRGLQAQKALLAITLCVPFSAVGTHDNDKNHYSALYRLQNSSVSIVSFNSHKNHLRSAVFALCITGKPRVTDMLLNGLQHSTESSLAVSNKLYISVLLF